MGVGVGLPFRATSANETRQVKTIKSLQYLVCIGGIVALGFLARLQAQERAGVARLRKALPKCDIYSR